MFMLPLSDTAPLDQVHAHPGAHYAAGTFLMSGRTGPGEDRFARAARALGEITEAVPAMTAGACAPWRRT